MPEITKKNFWITVIFFMMVMAGLLIYSNDQTESTLDMLTLSLMMGSLLIIFGGGNLSSKK